MKQNEQKTPLAPWVRDEIAKHPVAVTWTSGNPVPLFFPAREGAIARADLPSSSQLGGDIPRHFPKHNGDEIGNEHDPVNPPVSDPPVSNRAHTPM